MKKIGVLTSGGDAPGMNAAVRAVVRTGLENGHDVFAIYEGYQGMVDGGNRIQKMKWQDVGGMLQKGGTVIGTARCQPFRTHEGRLQAAHNLVKQNINNLVVIGGDGSLTGATIFCNEWPELLAELVEKKVISANKAKQNKNLTIMGLVGSIDNDMWGTDISIGADTALHRITDAVDAISSTAASHQRSFVVEVMGRRCGYLALMSALATGSDWVLIPESPPEQEVWEDKMCEVLRKGRDIGRRDSIVIVAEGAQDKNGKSIEGEYVRQVLQERLNEDARVTKLGHVQRGGSPSAFDRNLSTLLGAHAVTAICSDQYNGTANLVGMIGNKISFTPLDECLQHTKEVNDAVKSGDFQKAMDLRGTGFKEAFQTLRTLVRAAPRKSANRSKKLRIAVVNAGQPAPGMNTAVRAAVRLGIDQGHQLIGVFDGFRGLIKGDLKELNWMSVNGWAHIGGSELGTNIHIPNNGDFYAIARQIEDQKIDALLVIGGWEAYQGAMELHNRRETFPAFNMPIVCIPATIANEIPGAELSVGADTALNNIVDAVDKIKQSAGAARRVFVVEVLGGTCGYLALMSAMATGAERAYLHEEGVSLEDLRHDVTDIINGFKSGKPMGLIIRSEGANNTYSTDFMCAVFEEEGRDLFTARQAILGHLQQGGDPTPFDRILASRMAAKSIQFIEEQSLSDEPVSAGIGLMSGGYRFTDLQDLPRYIDSANTRPKKQWWMELRPIARVMAKPGPNGKV